MEDLKILDSKSPSRHFREMKSNSQSWQAKPLLREIYNDFYKYIADELVTGSDVRSVELGSGLGNIKEQIPDCLRTDMVMQPWLDQVENAYELSFSNSSLDNLVLFDVFHHLKYPGTAVAEFHRVLRTGGRVIIFEPCISWLGRLVYGLLHPEPIAMNDKIDWLAPDHWCSNDADYYAAQGNATRVFLAQKENFVVEGFAVTKIARYSAFSYVASGGYSGPQLYPFKAYKVIKSIDKVLDLCPSLFATRLLVVLEAN